MDGLVWYEYYISASKQLSTIAGIRLRPIFVEYQPVCSGLSLCVCSAVVGFSVFLFLSSAIHYERILILYLSERERSER